jgi:hypothetical protein
VINEREGLVLGYKYNDVRAFDKNLAGFTIKLPRGHNYRNGDHIMFAAKQELDPVNWYFLPNFICLGISPSNFLHYGTSSKLGSKSLPLRQSRMGTFFA